MSVVFCLLSMSSISAYAADNASDDVPRFDIVGYKVDGSTIFSEYEITILLAPFTGKKRDFGTVQEALDRLEKEYRDRGFNTVQVILPEQELEKGLVRFKVIEMRVGKIKIVGNKFFSAENIRKSLPELKEGIIPKIADISPSLRAANENPAKKVNLQLQNSDKEDEIDALLQVKDEKFWKVGLTVDNTGDKQTGLSRTGYMFQHANLFDRDHLLTLQYITSPEKPKRVNIYSAGYRIPLYRLGDSIDLIAAYSDVDSGTITSGVLNLNVSGKGRIYGIKYNHNLGRVGDYEHKFIYGFDYKSFENKVDFAGTGLGNDVTIHPVSVTYSGQTAQAWGETGFNLAAVQNIPVVLGGRDNEQHFERVRANSTDQYRVLRYGANLGYIFPADWQGRLNFNGQYTDKPLVPGEQFRAGGATSARGFREGDLTNDGGYYFNAEVYTSDLCKTIGIDNWQGRLLAFYDRGDILRRKPLAGEKARDFIASTGLGMRLTGSKHFSLSLDYGYVLKPGATARTYGDTFWHVKTSLMY
ncbi:MAG: ShlB/FhaC/HecB family hemolysin secretion/activation protein [Nitrospirae bacterium]|nr:MAG: ShlB/FhaC/HecB family hemolysin secretion/activation protein [Nitrospirota bacterium]